MRNFKFINIILLALAMFFVQGCSSEDSSTDDGTGSVDGNNTSTILTISMTLRDGPSSSDSEISSISTQKPGYLSIHVEDQHGVAASGQVLAVSTAKAQVDSKSLLTDSQGNATTIIEFKSETGADTIEVSTKVDKEEFNASIGFFVDAPSLSISMTLRDGPTSAYSEISSISILKPGYLSIHVEDQDGVAASGKVVELSTNKAQADPDSLLTDSEGNATAILEFKNETGADTLDVSAKLDNEVFNASLGYSVVAPALQLGDNSGASFITQQLEVAAAVLSSDGSTSIKAYFVDENGVAFSDPVAINFSSICSNESPPLASLDNTVVTSSGVATSTYIAEGCVGPDIITAEAVFGGATFTATGRLEVAPEQAGSISFISATPEAITLLGGGGAGLTETSELMFQVLGSSGSPLAGQKVIFTPNGTAGGLTISPTSAISNAYGNVSTVVHSGSVPAVVNITATVDSTNISTQSTGLVISAGLPDYDSFTLSPTIHNPEALLYDNIEVPITVQLGDIYQNPPPAGTKVSFTAEGGVIPGSCTTDESGRCSVKWSSGDPRPADFRATILAYTQGVESFIDENGDGYLSNDEIIPYQLPEVVRDDNESGDFDTGEFYVDSNENQSYDEADLKYNGNLCNDTTGRCSTQTTINISRSFVIVYSDSFANISAESGGTLLADQAQNQQNSLDIVDTTKTVKVTYSDRNGQPLPSGTTIKVTTDVGKLIGTTSFTFQETSVAGSRDFEFEVKDSNQNADPLVPDPNKTKTGRVTITVKTPKGNETQIFFTVNE